MVDGRWYDNGMADGMGDGDDANEGVGGREEGGGRRKSEEGGKEEGMGEVGRGRREGGRNKMNSEVREGE